MNPRTQKVDYISSTLDLLSAEAFHSGVRHSQWNETITGWLPISISPQHFRLAKPLLEKSIVKLSPHWKTSRFHPFMTLEVIPKLMNTMVVLLSDKGLQVSERALDGYFMLWRLLGTCVEAYGLEKEVRCRLRSFMDPSNRTKEKVPSLGDLLPLISVCSDPGACWVSMSRPVLEESFDRNVLWTCRDHPEYARPETNVKGQGADVARLAATMESTKVSKRLLMFHVLFLKSIRHQSVDLFLGRPPQHVRRTFGEGVRSILAVKAWTSFFAAYGLPCPGPASLTDLLKQATKNSLRKKYHTSTTNFSRIQASGVSHILRKGEKYQMQSGVRQVHLELGSDSEMILCGACLVYEDLTCASVVSFDSASGYKGAVKHSGDMQVNGKSMHLIDVDLAKLPSSVTRLFLTLCSCGCTDLSGFKTPSIRMQDSKGAALCTYNLEQAGNAPTVVMAAISRSEGAWQVTAIGKHSGVRCCGNYSQVKRDIASLRF